MSVAKQKQLSNKGGQVNYKPVLAYSKNPVVQRSTKQAVAPPAYKPLPVPKVLQTKTIQKKDQTKTNPKQVFSAAAKPQSPRVTVQAKRPVDSQRKSPAAPPVYRPQLPPKVLQTKKSSDKTATDQKKLLATAQSNENAGHKPNFLGSRLKTGREPINYVQTLKTGAPAIQLKPNASLRKVVTHHQGQVVQKQSTIQRKRMTKEKIDEIASGWQFSDKLSAPEVMLLTARALCDSQANYDEEDLESLHAKAVQAGYKRNPKLKEGFIDSAKQWIAERDAPQPKEAVEATASSGQIESTGYYRSGGGRWTLKSTHKGVGGKHVEQKAYADLSADQKDGWVAFVQNAAPCPEECRGYFKNLSKTTPGFIFVVTANHGGYCDNYDAKAPCVIYFVNDQIKIVPPDAAPGGAPAPPS